MITILLGTDTFSKEAHIKKALAGKDVERTVFRSGDTVPPLTSLGEPTLFGPARVYMFDHCWSQIDTEQLLTLAPSLGTTVFVLEDSLDKRKSINQKILKEPSIAVMEFNAPQGKDAVQWITAHAKDLGFTIETATAQDLYAALAPEEGELPVLRAHNEIMKLGSFADGETVTANMVVELTRSVVAIDIFALLNKIGSKDKKTALRMLEDFFEYGPGDDKAKAIQITSLFADQLRNMLLVLDADVQRLPEAELLKQTGWKSGRLFMVKKLARGFTPQKIRQTLAKLENLKRLKSF